MNIDTIKDALYNSSNKRRITLAKESCIRFEDKDFVDRFNSALDYAITYQMNDNKVELMFMRK